MFKKQLLFLLFLGTLLGGIFYFSFEDNQLENQKINHRNKKGVVLSQHPADQLVAALELNHATQQIDKLKRTDSIELKKSRWAKLLANHPYSKRKSYSLKEWKSIPKYDRPDLAFELDVLKTMDPALGRIPEGRLEVARNQMNEMMQTRAAIAGVSWVERGPTNVGGRTRALMFDPNDVTNRKVWAAGVGGGLWYTNDITAASPVWNKVNDFWNNIGVTCIAYNPGNTQELYVGTGEGFGNADSQRGAGIWKSTDGGVTWNQLANTNPAINGEFYYVQKIVVKNDGTVFAATSGIFINVGGIQRSTNGGANWNMVRDVYVAATFNYDNACDIELASNGDLYCSFGSFSLGRVFKSTNANNGAAGTWTDLGVNIGLTGNEERIELACAPSNSSVIYAVARNTAGGDTDIAWLKRSTDAGVTWNNMAFPLMVDGTGDHFTRSQSWYDLILKVHPTNSDYVIAGGIDLHRTTNGGAAWFGISHWYGGFGQPEVHADQHAIDFRPGNTNEVIFGNDGGVYYSTNAGNSLATPTFSNKNNGYNVTQFYACAGKNELNSNYFLTGAQDNGSQRFTQPQLNATTEVTGGDGGFCHIDTDNSNLQMTSYTNNVIYLSTDGGATFPQIVNDGSGHFINPSDYDSQLNILFCAADDNQIKRVSGIGGAIVNANLAVAIGGAGSAQISTLKESTYNDVVFFGVENGRIYKYTNASTGAPVLTRIDNGAGSPITAAGWVSSIDVGANDNQLLVTYSNYGVTSVWETADGGVNWRNKEGNLPDMPIRWAIYNPNNRNQVLAATELGVWSTDNFQNGVVGAPVWGVSNTGLANTRCDMLELRPIDNLVMVATHGRGLFTTDIFVVNPVADFTYDQSNSCSGSLTVNFTDASLKPNSSWAWDVDNNGSVDYTVQNPTHTYAAPGIYTVTLTVSSGGATVTKTNVILVTASGPVANTSCAIVANSNAGNGFGIGLSRFALQAIDNSTSNNDAQYMDFSCSRWTELALNTTYNITITTGTANNEAASVYIDYNNNGVFGAGETVANFPANMVGTRTLAFTTPAAGVTFNTPLRLRVTSKFSSAPTTPCNTATYGQIEDYTVYFYNASLGVDLVDFKATCENGSALIEWETASEEVNGHFVIEKSTDGEKWMLLTTIDGQGSTQSTTNYRINDSQLNLAEVVYYRLTQVDIDGATTTYNPISLLCNETSLIVYPNPTSGLVYFNGLNNDANLRLLDNQGKLLEIIQIKNGKSIDLSNYSNGIYYYEVQHGIELAKGKIVLQKK
ncbi:MAG: GEVED domain-containing protein [Fluviicola sp.]|nr:GEVED domain-containing protein [Fluviicola sp.]